MTLGSASDWNGSLAIAACQPFDRELGLQRVHVGYNGLITAMADETLYPQVVTSQPILAPNSNFVATDGWLNSGGVLIGTNGAYWPKLDSVNLYVSAIEQQLVGYQSDLSNLHAYFSCEPIPDYFSSHWPDEFESLYSQANHLGVGNSRLRRARRLAQWNTVQACRFVANEIRQALTERIAHLRRRLRVAKALKSKLLRLVASVYRFRNQIVLQRRYYLAHGSHPIEDSSCQETWWSLDQRGCVPAFPQ
ncbi:MAG: hypothetical protein WA609_08225 [Terriglobales bacterium]